MLRAAAALALLAGAAAAETPVPPDAFRALTEGRTLRFEWQGLPYGVERYGPDRRVIWRGPDGECRHGRWTPGEGAICFRYDDAPAGTAPRCWRVLRDAEGLLARPLDDPGFELRFAGEADGPPDCPGPDVGT